MKEKISALMDGELDAAEVIDELRVEGEALDTWRTYHLISDAMRDTRLLSPGFTARVAERLAAEPTVLAPIRKPQPVQRFALAAAAGVAGVALVGWMAFAPQPQAPVAVAKAPAPAAIPLSASANDYLLAHQGFSPRVSLQGMAPYVRTVAEYPETGAK
jgi:sigma-E factor negative regulatory protein RseA